MQVVRRYEENAEESGRRALIKNVPGTRFGASNQNPLLKQMR